MSRFIAVECDDDVSRIHDAHTGTWARLSFMGPQAFAMATGCARKWNEIWDAQAAKMDEWLDL